MGKTYETINCECGHECPVEFAISNDEGQWTCPNCYEEYVHDLCKTLRDKNVCDGKCAIETAAKCTLVDVSKSGGVLCVDTLPTDEEEIKLLTTFLDHYIIHRSTYMDWKTEDVATQWLDVRKKLLIMMRRGNGC